MARRTRTRGATVCGQYSVDTEWSETDLSLLEELQKAETHLPDDAPRALLSVRLSVKGVRSPHIHMELMTPRDVRDRLLLKEDDFAEAF